MFWDFPVVGKMGSGDERAPVLRRMGLRGSSIVYFDTDYSFLSNKSAPSGGQDRPHAAPSIVSHRKPQRGGDRCVSLVPGEGRRAAGESGLEWRMLRVVNSSHASSSSSAWGTGIFWSWHGGFHPLLRLRQIFIISYQIYRHGCSLFSFTQERWQESCSWSFTVCNIMPNMFFKSSLRIHWITKGSSRVLPVTFLIGITLL